MLENILQLSVLKASSWFRVFSIRIEPKSSQRPYKALRTELWVLADLIRTSNDKDVCTCKRLPGFSCRTGWQGVSHGCVYGTPQWRRAGMYYGQFEQLQIRAELRSGCTCFIIDNLYILTWYTTWILISFVRPEHIHVLIILLYFIIKHCELRIFA